MFKGDVCVCEAKYGQEGPYKLMAQQTECSWRCVQYHSQYLGRCDDVSLGLGG